MDTRLFRIETRPGRLFKQDLPLLARALVGYYRGFVKVKTGLVRNVRYVRLEAPDFHVQLMASDWAKILPYIQSDDFNQSVVKSQIDTVYNSSALYSSSIIDRTDSVYYTRVLSTLEQLFPGSYPTAPRAKGFDRISLDLLEVVDQTLVAIVYNTISSDTLDAHDSVSLESDWGSGASVGVTDDVLVSVDIGTFASDTLGLLDDVASNVFMHTTLTQEVFVIDTTDVYWSPNKLTDDLYAIFGTDLVGLWVGEDLVLDGSSNITSWVGRVGPTLTPESSELHKAGVLNGRKCISNTSAAFSRSLKGVVSTNILDEWVVAVTPAQPFGDYYSCLQVRNTYGAVMCNSGTTSLYTGQGSTHYIDGVVTENLALGTHVIEGRQEALLSSSSIYVGNNVSCPIGWSWLQPILFCMALTNVPSASNRAAALALIQDYYGL